MLGKIAEPYGIRGWIKIYPFADDPLDWATVSDWWVGRENQQNQWKPCKLLQLKAHGSVLLAQLESVDDRTAAEALKGQLVGAPKASLPKLAEGEFYWADLLGLKVTNPQGQCLGVVEDLIETGANDVLRVVDSDGQERLIPYVDAVVLRVDVALGEIMVNWELDW